MLPLLFHSVLTHTQNSMNYIKKDKIICKLKSSMAQCTRRAMMEVKQCQKSRSTDRLPKFFLYSMLQTLRSVLAAAVVTTHQSLWAGMVNHDLFS
jgi:hypothetical protein